MGTSREGAWTLIWLTIRPKEAEEPQDIFVRLGAKGPLPGTRDSNFPNQHRPQLRAPICMIEGGVTQNERSLLFVPTLRQRQLEQEYMST